MIFFFFSSRRRHTRSLCDWSSDVCSSDLRNDDGAYLSQQYLLRPCRNLIRSGAVAAHDVSNPRERRPIIVIEWSILTERHFTACVSLAALGVQLKHLDLFGPIRETVLIAQKTIKHAPSDELAGAVRTMASQDDVRSGRIFALANSEGTLHALNYQVHRPAIPFAGLVLIGPPGRAVGTVARAQLAAQASGIPNGEALLSLYDAAIARFQAEEPIGPNPSLPEGFPTLLIGLERPINLPLSPQLC